MKRSEMAAQAAEWLNAAEPRLNATVRVEGQRVYVGLRAGKREATIEFPSHQHPTEGYRNPSLAMVKSVVARIESMPRAED